MDRILFTAPESGSGKTLAVLAFLEVLRRRGLRPAAFKCGPDFIDPMFHRAVLKEEVSNLDSFFSGEDDLRALFLKRAEGADLAVIEGVMGYYDGLGGTGERASTYDVGRILSAPAVLVVNGKRSSFSLAALVRGFREFRPDSRIRGVILDRVKPAMARALAPVIEVETGVPVLGCLPESDAYRLDSRHLGLVLPGEVAGLRGMISAAADALAQNTDIGRILRIAGEAPELQGVCKAAELQDAGDTQKLQDAGDAQKLQNAGGSSEPRVRTDAASLEKERRVKIGVALDEAFCFYYRDNLELLQSFGAEPVYFSPLHDCSLPEGISGLILGGGYPELHARALSENEAMRAAVRAAFLSGMPCLAECGGFLYLHERLEDTDGIMQPMAGVFPFSARKTDRLDRFGYITVTAKGQTGQEESIILREDPSQDGPALLAGGEEIRGHEFHYWESEDPGSSWRAAKPSGRGWDCMHVRGAQAAGFPHLYYPSAPEFLKRWTDCCRAFGRMMHKAEPAGTDAAGTGLTGTDPKGKDAVKTGLTGTGLTGTDQEELKDG